VRPAAFLLVSLAALGWAGSGLGCARPSGKFRSESEQKKILDRELARTATNVRRMRMIGVEAKDELSLDFFFYTDTQAKATGLVEALKGLELSARARPGTEKNGPFVVHGTTREMPMEESVLSKWVETMCKLGSDHDAEFDAWGTKAPPD